MSHWQGPQPIISHLGGEVGLKGPCQNESVVILSRGLIASFTRVTQFSSQAQIAEHPCLIKSWPRWSSRHFTAQKRMVNMGGSRALWAVCFSAQPNKETAIYSRFREVFMDYKIMIVKERQISRTALVFEHWNLKSLGKGYKVSVSWRFLFLDFLLQSSFETLNEPSRFLSTVIAVQ